MFAILFEVLLIEVQEEIHHFAGWEGGGVKGHKNSEQKFREQTGVSYFLESVLLHYLFSDCTVLHTQHTLEIGSLNPPNHKTQSRPKLYQWGSSKQEQAE